MTAISNIFDALVTLVDTALSNHTRIPNPYVLEHNTELFLKKGYGVAFGPGELERREICAQAEHRRTFTVIITRQVTTTDHNVTARASIEKNLLEDYNTLRIALEQDHTLGALCTDIDYTEDSGVIYTTAADNLRYVLIEVSMLVRYQENLP